MSDKDPIELTQEQFKDLIKDGAIDGGFIGLAQMLTGATGADALFLLVDRPDESIHAGVVIRPGYTGVDSLIEALEKTLDSLKESREAINAKASHGCSKCSTKH